MDDPTIRVWALRQIGSLTMPVDVWARTVAEICQSADQSPLGSAPQLSGPVPFER